MASFHNLSAYGNDSAEIGRLPPPVIVMEQIGHASEQISEHYTHVGSEALKKAAESLPDLIE